jgi:hypothetical protein
MLVLFAGVAVLSAQCISCAESDMASHAGCCHSKKTCHDKAIESSCPAVAQAVLQTKSQVIPRLVAVMTVADQAPSIMPGHRDVPNHPPDRDTRTQALLSVFLI